jgi:hypothetical protein
MRKGLMVAFFAVALFIAGIAGSVSADDQKGLVNVKVGDLCLACGNDILITDVVDIVATVCPNVDVDAIQVIVGTIASGDTDQTTVCKTLFGQKVVVFNNH